jgi:hypothetical protein
VASGQVVLICHRAIARKNQLEAFTPFVRAIDRSAAAIDSGQCLGGKTRTARQPFPGLAKACIGLTHLWRNGSDLPAMPGPGRSVYREAGRSSSERVTPTGHEKTGSKKRGTTTQPVTHACGSAMHVFPPPILAWSQTCLNSRRCACACLSAPELVIVKPGVKTQYDAAPEKDHSLPIIGAAWRYTVQPSFQATCVVEGIEWGALSTLLPRGRAFHVEYSATHSQCILACK